MITKQSYMKKSVQNLVKTKKKVLKLHKEMYCIMNFLSFSVATSKKQNFISTSKSMLFVLLQHMSFRALL